MLRLYCIKALCWRRRRRRGGELGGGGGGEMKREKEEEVLGLVEVKEEEGRHRLGGGE